MVSLRRLTVDSTDESHRVTTLELFFDLVFVFALTQITAFMADEPTARGLSRGMLVFLLVWLAWTSYAWLGNQARADEGVLRVALVAAMIAMLIVSITIPNVWSELDEGLIDPLVFAVFYVVVRAVHLAAYAVAAGGDRALLRRVARSAGPASVAGALLIIGSFFDPHVQLMFWISALAVDYFGTYTGRMDGWQLPAPGHFAERHGLVVIIALGESIIAVGVTVSGYPLTWTVVIASILAAVVAVCLWWLYFDVVAIVAEHVLAGLRGKARVKLARDSYSYLHVPIVAGIIFFALGAKKALAYVADPEKGPWEHLSTVPTVALYGGVVMYLAGHIAFRWRNVRTISRRRVVVAVVLALLVPVAMQLAVLLALALLAAVLVALVAYEAVRYADARRDVRHGNHDHLLKRGAAAVDESPATS